MKKYHFALHLLVLSLNIVCFCLANDISGVVFGDIQGIVAAFGDFNSDELTDVFIIQNDLSTMQILYGAEVEPLLRRGPHCTFGNRKITSIVPGDFDGDALMDVLVTISSKSDSKNNINEIYINWGEENGLSCANSTNPPVIITEGEPIAIDYNRDMIIDLYGVKQDVGRVFWVFQKFRLPPKEIRQPSPFKETPIIPLPNANAYLDLNNDFTADLFVQTDKFFEIWNGRTEEPKEDFSFNHTIDISLIGTTGYTVGQAVFVDLQLEGVENLILPVCFSDDCSNSAILVHDGKNFQNLHINFKDSQNVQWGFVKPRKGDIYLKAITARAGDYNMDGYPDLIVTLRAINGPNLIKTFLLENVPCKLCRKNMKRTYEVKWNAFFPMGNNTVAGAFYDFYQDGVLDVILIERLRNEKYRPLAFRNTLDYDANFIKVIVLTGLINKKNPTQRTPLGRKKRTYGTNLPGPRITYTTTTQDGDLQRGSSVQLPQSSYFALQLPYTIFGLGRTPNFVDSLIVGLGSRSRGWTQLIPNSQIIVVPKPVDDPQCWKAQLFVTPSKLIFMSVIALGGTCLVIVLIILLLYIKEKRQDKQEKLQEAHRFHYDAM